MVMLSPVNCKQKCGILSSNIVTRISDLPEKQYGAYSGPGHNFFLAQTASPRPAESSRPPRQPRRVTGLSLSGDGPRAGDLRLHRGLLLTLAGILRDWRVKCRISRHLDTIGLVAISPLRRPAPLRYLVRSAPVFGPYRRRPSRRPRYSSPGPPDIPSDGLGCC